MAEPAPPVRRWLFAITILAGSFLLFLVQPMVARMALPRLGGAPNVWNSAMLVYQTLLLGGYAYAHVLSRLPIARQAAIHVVLLVLAGLTLPIALPDIAPPASGREALWVPWLFLLTVGPVFFVVSAQAPLMQRWFATHPQASDPYPLYAASNLGSFAGLLAYPLLAEPLFSIRTQSLGWTAGYGVLVALVALTSLSRTGPGRVPEATNAERPAPSLGTIALWLALSAVPSGLMLSTTTYLTTDIFAMPLLWVIPLGLYLLSFSIAFAARRGLAVAITAASPVVVLAAGGIAMFTSAETNLAAAAASIVLLFVAAVALHTRLYSLRPEPSRLTQFYLVMSAGGALGGLFTALFAPLLFDWTWEHPMLIVAAAALLPLGTWRALLGRLVPPGRPFRMVFAVLLFVAFMGALWLQHYANPEHPPGVAEIAVFAAVVAAGTLLAARRWASVAVCAFLVAALGGITQWQITLSGARSRSYFGIYTVRTTPGERVLLHGKTIHGVQRLDPGRATEPTSYYGRRGGAGLVMQAAESLYGPHARIGVVGLGVGTLACYRRPGQAWTFFEIDPAVLAYSRRHLFTYLDRCAKGVPVVIGDARLRLASATPGSFDILAIDAFSSDAIPLHLLTKEAHEVYFRALAADGILLVHISNRYVELESVVSALAREEHLAAMVRLDRPASGWPLAESKWVVLSRDRTKLAALTRDGGWRDLGPPTKSVWTDDYASILPQLTWRRFL